MLKLSGRVISNSQLISGVYSVSTDIGLPLILRKTKAFYIKDHKNIPQGYKFYLSTESDVNKIKKIDLPLISLKKDFEYIDNHDIIKIYDDGFIAVLFRANSNHNSFLVTEQCNHYCLMCSQPPKNRDDSFLLNEIKEAIPLVPKWTQEIGFTGGEPTLFGDRFLDLLRLSKSYLPNTAVHILSNGRAFTDHDFVRKYSDIDHHDMMIGIPLYSDDPKLHDYIVQAEGAFDETILGILNLKKLKQQVELRVVIHQQSIKTLVSLCEFITRNLLFVDHVALMGLEMMGFTRANIDKLWIDPYEYKDTLSEATKILQSSGMNVSIYNHQLCLINEDVKPFYKKSISDWKNEFAPECKVCSKSTECGGFFSSGLKHKYSINLKPYGV
ncbi:His-Xaa-Ser system radical SAM maturase HxsC [Methylophilaceae bacterium]|nr:His-Xaa-Ser system radical SAM maturase HxsC [Methylophilaceae bacterium]